VTTLEAGFLVRLTRNDRYLVPLAGLEPAACCLGDVSAQTLCRGANFQVTIDRRAKGILWCWWPSLVGHRRLYCPHQINVQRR
jgi:hypothetical protein